MPPLRSHKRRRVACQHFPDDQTLRLQAGAGEDDVIHLPSGLDRVDCERQEEEEEHKAEEEEEEEEIKKARCFGVPKLPQVKRRVERPSKTWSSIEKEMKTTGTTWGAVKEAAQNRVLWRVVAVALCSIRGRYHGG